MPVGSWLGDDLHQIEIMLKLFVQLYLAHTPEIPQRRYANYQAAVAERVAEDDRAGAQPKNIKKDLKD